MKKEENELETLVKKLANQLSKHCDGVIILCSHHDERGTNYIARGEGNRHAILGAMEEYLSNVKAAEVKSYLEWIEGS